MYAQPPPSMLALPPPPPRPAAPMQLPPSSLQAPPPSTMQAPPPSSLQAPPPGPRPLASLQAPPPGPRPLVPLLAPVYPPPLHQHAVAAAPPHYVMHAPAPTYLPSTVGSSNGAVTPTITFSVPPPSAVYNPSAMSVPPPGMFSQQPATAYYPHATFPASSGQAVTAVWPPLQPIIQPPSYLPPPSHHYVHPPAAVPAASYSYLPNYPPPVSSNEPPLERDRSPLRQVWQQKKYLYLLKC